jgi:hypothetical protein
MHTWNSMKLFRKESLLCQLKTTGQVFVEPWGVASPLLG